MKFILAFLFLSLVASCSAQSSICSNAVAFCGSSRFVPSTQNVNAETGPNYGCIAEETGSPSWFFFQIASGNNVTINFRGTNNVDIDFAIWGPFVDAPPTSCFILDASDVAPVACSDSLSSTETAVLRTVTTGEFYLMLVTNPNLADTVVTVVLDFETTNGDLTCGIVSQSATPPPSSTPSLTPVPSPTPSPVSATPSTSDNVGEDCPDADPFCGFSTFNPGTMGIAQFGPNYGCLLQQPAPAWFFFRIGSGNNITIDFTSSQAVDIDYAIWGPFPTSDCSLVESGLISPVSCSYSNSSTEAAVLTTVVPGEFYIMVITNFDRLPTLIQARVNFTTTNGDLDCGIVPSASPSFSPSTSLTSSATASASFSPSLSESNTRAPSNTPTPSLSESNTATASRTPSGSISETRSASGSISESRSASNSRTPSRSFSATRTPSRTPTSSRSETPSISFSRSETPSNSPSRSFRPPRTTGLRTTGIDVARTTGVVNRTTGVVNRTTGVAVARTTGVVSRTTGARTTGVPPSESPSQTEIIASSSAAFSASPFFSLILVVVAFAFTIIA